MDFSDRKLPSAAAQDLRLCPISSVSPYAPMLGPVYVFLKRNQKFVAIKGPLDFFSPAEIAKYLPFESFFFAPSIDDTLPIREAAHRARAILSWQPRPLPPAPYELADASFQVLRELKRERWPALDLAVFANELCDPLDPSLLERRRDESMERYEQGLTAAGLAVWLALQAGYCELGYLSALRRQVFDAAYDAGALQNLSGEGQRLARYALDWKSPSFSIDELTQSPSTVLKKILGRWRAEVAA